MCIVVPIYRPWNCSFFSRYIRLSNSRILWEKLQAGICHKIWLNLRWVQRFLLISTSNQSYTPHISYNKIFINFVYIQIGKILHRLKCSSKKGLLRLPFKQLVKYWQFSNAHIIFSGDLNDRALAEKTLLREWAHLRYGLFDEIDYSVTPSACVYVSENDYRPISCSKQLTVRYHVDGHTPHGVVLYVYWANI